MELGGCCLSRYGSVAVLPSKAERILSRYRPIAPKPIPLSIAPVPDSDRASIPSLDASRHVPDASARSRKVRKRRCESLSSPRPSKRLASSKSDCSLKERSSLSGSVAAGSVLTERSLSGVSGRDGFASVVKGTKRTMSVEAPESSQTSVLGGASVVAISSGLMDSTRMMEQDVGFMERAAASAPPSVLPDRRMMTSRGSGGFTEMIRGITGLPTAADVHTLLQQSSKAPPELLLNCSTDLNKEGFAMAVVQSVHVENVLDGERMDGACTIEGAGREREHEDHHSRNLVTLTLLPDTPSRTQSSPCESSISTCSTPANRHSFTGEESHSRFFKGSFSDLVYIEQMYGTSPEPVLMMDNSRNILWVNRAYERAYKDASDRQAGKSPTTVPFIDPLGSPTQLGTFNLQFQGCGHINATLWGFLKKFVVDAGGERSSEPSFPRLVDKSQTKGMFKLECTGPSDCEPCKTSSVIVPQPLRLVGSTVSLESVTDIQLKVEATTTDAAVAVAAATSSSDSLIIMKKQLEDGVSPAFITDSCNSVKWVNTAYKKMVGQPECPWLVSTVSDSKMVSSSTSSSPRLMGEVLLISSVEIPLFAASFSGRANIQWTNTGEKTCMTVPCDVSRLDNYCSNDKLILVWKFDIDASLRLTCGV